MFPKIGPILLKDRFDRQITDLRVSVTDRCNFKCFYCRTPQGSHFANRESLLTYEEIERLARIFVELGITKIRLTGGEPLLRKNLELLVGKLSSIGRLEDLALTTNGFDFYERADSFKSAGLTRVTISLDSLNRERFREITGYPDYGNVLMSIEKAKELKLEPVKVNCVLIRGVNDDEIVDFGKFASDWDVEVRFIEFMPIDEEEQWAREKVVTGSEILQMLKPEFDLLPLPRENESDTAQKFEISNGNGRIGLILPVSEPFCGNCSRVRLTADGKIRTCLFSLIEHDVRDRMRAGASDEEVRKFLVSTVLKKEKGHRIGEPDFVPPSRSMSYIGG